MFKVKVIRLIISVIALWLPLRAESDLYAAAYWRNGDVVGVQSFYQVQRDDTLLEIARAYDIGYDAIVASNPKVDPFIPDLHRLIVLPTAWILPDVTAPAGIVVNIAEMRLYVFLGVGTPQVQSFPVGVGDIGKETPVGRYHVIEKIEHPYWYVPKSIQLEKPELPAIVPPGPDNPMGSYALRLSDKTILIHGTNRPWGIGTRNTHGCIRLYPEDISRLFRMIDVETPVIIVNQPVKAVFERNYVYLQVHDYGDGRDLYEEALKVLTRKKLMDQVDLVKVRKAVREKTGLMTVVSR